MRKVCSRYRIFGGFGLLAAMSLMVGFVTYNLIIKGQHIQLFTLSSWVEDQNLKTVLITSAVAALVITLFCTQNQFIIISHDQITFINPLLPFIRATRQWDEYDYYITVQEDASGGPHEAVWLTRNGRIKNRISSFCYSNYEELERKIGCRFSGTLRPNFLKQFCCLLGMKVN